MDNATTITVIGALIFLAAVVFWITIKIWMSITSKILKIKEQEKYIDELESRKKAIYLDKLPIPPQAEFCKHDWHTITDKIIEVPGKKSHTVILKCSLCGVVDKSHSFIEEEPPLPPVTECRHKWKEKIKVELESAYDQLHRTLKYFNSQYGMSGKKKITDTIAKKINDSDNDNMLFRKAVVRVYECTNCGKLYEVKAANYDEMDDSCDSCDS